MNVLLDKPQNVIFLMACWRVAVLACCRVGVMACWRDGVLPCWRFTVSQLATSGVLWYSVMSTNENVTARMWIEIWKMLRIVSKCIRTALCESRIAYYIDNIRWMRCIKFPFSDTRFYPDEWLYDFPHDVVNGIIFLISNRTNKEITTTTTAITTATTTTTTTSNNNNNNNNNNKYII